MTMLGLCSCTGFSLLLAEWGSPLVVMCRLLIEVASFIVEHDFRHEVSVVVVCGLQLPDSRAQTQ